MHLSKPLLAVCAACAAAGAAALCAALAHGAKKSAPQKALTREWAEGPDEFAEGPDMILRGETDGPGGAKVDGAGEARRESGAAKAGAGAGAAGAKGETPAPDKAPGGADAPNKNPVDAQPAARATGKLDPLTIASADDFQDWEALGCRS